MPYKDKVKQAAYLKQWRDDNWPQYRKSQRKHEKKFPWRTTERMSFIRCGRQPRDIKACQAVYELAEMLNRSAGWKKYEVDHIIPVKHGGVHQHWNIQVLTRKANSAKGSKYMYANV